MTGTDKANCYFRVKKVKGITGGELKEVVGVLIPKYNATTGYNESLFTIQTLTGEVFDFKWEHSDVRPVRLKNEKLKTVAGRLSRELQSEYRIYRQVEKMRHQSAEMLKTAERKRTASLELLQSATLSMPNSQNF